MSTVTAHLGAGKAGVAEGSPEDLVARHSMSGAAPFAPGKLAGGLGLKELTHRQGATGAALS